MKQRGRKSAAKLAVVTEIADIRPKPPADLTEAEKTLFNSITKSRNADFFDDATVPLLAEYCRQKTSVDLLATQIGEFTPEWLEVDEHFKDYNKLCRLRDVVHGRMLALARTLRITQQSRFVPDSRKTKAGVASKPWET